MSGEEGLDEDGSEPPSDPEDTLDGDDPSNKPGTYTVPCISTLTIELDVYKGRVKPQPTKHLKYIHDKLCRTIDRQVRQ